MSTTSSSQQMSARMKFFFSRIFPLIFVAVGASVAFFGIRGLVRAKASVEWPAAQGRIASSVVERHYSSSNGRSSTTYHAAILYEFSVHGATFNGTRVAYGDYGSSDPSHAREIVNRYPEGKAVTVHYMPGNPEECVLEPGLKAQSWFMPAFGLIFFAAGILMAIYIPKAMAKQQNAEPDSQGDAAKRTS